MILFQVSKGERFGIRAQRACQQIAARAQDCKTFFLRADLRRNAEVGVRVSK
jgi:hypothetical protein